MEETESNSGQYRHNSLNFRYRQTERYSRRESNLKMRGKQYSLGHLSTPLGSQSIYSFKWGSSVPVTMLDTRYRWRKKLTMFSQQRGDRKSTIQ